MEEKGKGTVRRKDEDDGVFTTDKMRILLLWGS